MPKIFIDPLEAVHKIEPGEEVAVIILGTQYILTCEVDGEDYKLRTTL